MDQQTTTLTDADVIDADSGTGRRMSFLEHLEELRRRIIYSLYALIVGCIAGWYFVGRIFHYMLGYFGALGGKMIYTELTGAFMFEFKTGLLLGLFIASPFIFSQFWFFVAPGLYTRERKVVIPFVVASTILFVLGAAFAHLIAFPNMWRFFANFANDKLAFMPTINMAFSFYIKMILGLGLVFEMPMLVFFLARFGIVTWRFLVDKAKYAIVIIFVIAAIASPTPDPINQCIFAAPMLVLYALSIGVAAVFGKKKPSERSA